MSSRLFKELRPLILPWAVAAASGLVPPPGVGEVGLVYSFASFAWFGSIAILAASSFGVEFHERTLPLLLSQPQARERIWREKLLVAGLAALALALVNWRTRWFASGLFPAVTWLSPESFNADGAVLAGAFLLATICSAGCWTIMTRSTIGGAVFTAVSQFAVLLGMKIVVSNWYGADLSFEARPVLIAVLMAAPIYSALFLWLGWRKFDRLELREVAPGESARPAAWGASAHWWSQWLCCRPEGGLLNLARKELRLQKPLAMLAAVFSGCFTVSLLLHWLQPQQGYQHLLDLLICAYVPLFMILAGCLSLGEERALGLASWHLTLPVAVRIQWWIKLAMSALTAVVLGLLLPRALTWIATGFPGTSASAFANRDDSPWMQLSLLSGPLFVLSFWASTLVANTVRAALLATIAFVALCSCAMLGTSCAERYGGLIGHWGSARALVLALRGGVPYPDLLVFGVISGLGLFAGFALFQSYSQFQRVDLQNQTLIRRSLALALVAFGLFFCLSDLLISAGR